VKPGDGATRPERLLLLLSLAALVPLAALTVGAGRAQALEKKATGNVVVEWWQVEDSVSVVRGNVLVYGEVRGDVSSGFGGIRVEGPVGGDVDAGWGDVFVDAPVGGDVRLGNGKLVLGPDADVKGRIYVASGRFKPYPGARFDEVHSAGMSPPGSDGGPPERSFAGLVGRLVAAALLAAVAVLAVVLVPRPIKAAVTGLDASPGRAALLGVATLPAVLLLSVALALTGVGLLLLPLLLPAYLALVLCGLLVSSYALGRRVLLATGRYRAGDAIAAGVGALLVAAVSLVPYLGSLLAALLALTGVGAVLIPLLARRRHPRASCGEERAEARGEAPVAGRPEERR
jgi:hypothetical protein